MLHLRSSGAADPAPVSANLLRFLVSEQDTSTWDQALWTGIVVGLFLGFLAAVSTEWLVEQFQQKDAGAKPRPSRPSSSPRDDVLARPSRKPTNDDVHSWLNSCSEAEARDFLSTFAQGPRGYLLGEAVGNASPRFDKFETSKSQGPQPEQLARSVGEQLLADPLSPEVIVPEEASRQASSSSSSQLPLIQFAQFMHLVNEGEECATLEVIRLGNLGVQTQVSFFTEDSSAVAGGSYVETHGTLVFAPGEYSKIIEVPIMDNNYWDATLEFKVHLRHDSLVNGRFERSMWHARVKLIDNSTFPSNKFSEQIKAGKVDEIPKFSMLYEYIMFNLCNPKVRKGTIKMILIEQCHNANFFLRLCITIFLVDTVLTTHPGQQLDTHQERIWALVGVALLNLIPMVVLHYFDFHALGMGVRGGSKMTLQKALIAKFLAYGVESRTLLRPGIVTMAITHDAEDLVDDGYMAIIDLAKSVGDIITMLIFQFTVPPMLGRSLNLGVILALFGLPLLESFLFLRRKEVTTDYLQQKHDNLEALSKRTHETVEQQTLIAAYQREAQSMDKVTEQIVAKNKCDAGTAQLLLNNNYIGTWLLTLLVSFYFFFGGREVLRGRLPLGLFLADISVFQTIGMSCNKITELFQSMEMATPALERIVTLLNLSDDLVRRQQLNKKTRSDVRQLLEGLTQITIDDLPIRVADVQYKYTRPGFSSLWKPVNLRGVMQIQQGSLVSLVGKRRQGKSTLLKMLGGELLLQEEAIAGPRSQVFIPPHVRVIQVQGEPVFFDGTLYDNLTYGVSHHRASDASSDGPPSSRRNSDIDGDMSRVVKICEMLGLSEDVLRYINSNESNAWKGVLASTDSYILSLARALIANPQVLCVHKPTLLFDEVSSKKILEMLRSFVRDRGLVQDVPLHERRPRTCIFTSSKLAGVEISDQVFHVSNVYGIQSVDKDQVTPEMLL